MTRIGADHPTKRETAAVYRRRPLVAELHPLFLRLWEKGRRSHVDVDYLTIYELAWKLEWRRQQAERPRRRRR